MKTDINNLKTLKYLFVFLLGIMIIDVSAQQVECTGTSQPIASVIQNQSVIQSNTTNFGDINDGNVMPDKGVAMNNTGHHMVLDLGQVYAPGTEIKMDIWGNGTHFVRDVVTSETSNGTYISGGGLNQQTNNVNINGSDFYTYTLQNATRYIQIDMVRRSRYRTEWTEVTITNSCLEFVPPPPPAGGAGGNSSALHPSSLKINYHQNTPLPENVVLGVNGEVYIGENSYDPANPEDYDTENGDLIREVKDEYEDQFLLFVEKGVVSEDLGIGGRSIWLADYVFDPEYKLTRLEEIKAYIQEYKHLPDVIGQKELDEQGYFQVDKMLMGQLKNLEELLLHTLAQEEKIKEQSQIQKTLKYNLDDIEKRIENLKKNRP